MTTVVLGMLFALALALVVVALVAIPARREGRELLTPQGEQLVQTARERAVEAASAARDRTAEVAGVALEKTAEVAGVALEKTAEVAGVALEKTAEVAGATRERVAERLAPSTRDRSSTGSPGQDCDPREVRPGVQPTSTAPATAPDRARSCGPGPGPSPQTELDIRGQGATAREGAPGS